MGKDFSAIPRDINWLPAMSSLGEAIALIGDTERAGSVYEQLLRTRAWSSSSGALFVRAGGPRASCWRRFWAATTTPSGI